MEGELPPLGSLTVLKAVLTSIHSCICALSTLVSLGLPRAMVAPRQTQSSRSSWSSAAVESKDEGIETNIELSMESIVKEKNQASTLVL
jgi:hypothetical protein